ncbi:flavin reductase family protein [Ornithinibacillus sp. L9]|uniref:Flavin reductase family protein n=1 Tax=Ornithinibacillus caprae TaxID=2678566 RepID=A0A6N8FNV3_9BACI|nr:flavin reductase family protein [Ornithinibacillus caprae]MUK90536.1 flavin reductase family protein [Ornithinibacillus caprae]
MIPIDPRGKSAKENYKLLIGSIIPRPIAFVTSLAEDGIVNGAPFSFFNVVSSNPPMISISVQRREGEIKDTARNILEKHEFVIHIVDVQNVQTVNTTAASLAANESEIEMANMTTVESDVITVPGVKEAKVRMEFKLEKHIELGEGDYIDTDFIIGKIVKYHMDDSVYNAETGRINYDALGAVSRLAGFDYAKIGDIFSIERPK